jgi:hypothetical protein
MFENVQFGGSTEAASAGFEAVGAGATYLASPGGLC